MTSPDKWLDPVTNQVTEQAFQDGKLFVRTVEDMEPLLEELAHERGMGNAGWSKGRTWRKMGSIPNVMIEKVLREEGINMMQDTPEAKARIRRFFAENPKLSTKY